MAKKKSMIEELMKKFGLEKNKKTGKKNNKIPQEILDKLPPGVKIKKIEMGPRQVLRAIIVVLLISWFLSTIKEVLVPEEIVQVPLSKVVEAIKKDESKEITVSDDQIVVNLKNEDKILVSSKEPGVSLTEILQGEGIDVSQINLKVENRQGWKAFLNLMSLFLTVGVPLLFIFWLFSRQTGKGGGGGMFGFGKSTAKLFIKGKQSVKFADVAGVEEAKNDLMEVVDFLKHP
ncbi:hypothetical protein KJ909_02190, partial [Patescibacteria group bacterium]|nr:hypothetical protein [Patescibacteria group bacterium]